MRWSGACGFSPAIVAHDLSCSAAIRGGVVLSAPRIPPRHAKGVRHKPALHPKGVGIYEAFFNKLLADFLPQAKF